MIDIAKRFTDAELAAELWRMRWVRCTAKRLSDVGGPSKKDNERLAALRRFASLPHYDDPAYEADMLSKDTLIGKESQDSANNE